MIQKKLKWAKDKCDVFSGALDVLNGEVNILSDEAKVSMKALWCVNNKFLNMFLSSAARNLSSKTDI